MTTILSTLILIELFLYSSLYNEIVYWLVFLKTNVIDVIISESNAVLIIFFIIIICITILTPEAKKVELSKLKSKWTLCIPFVMMRPPITTNTTNTTITHENKPYFHYWDVINSSLKAFFEEPYILNTYIDKELLIYSNILNVVWISFFIIILGIILPNKAKIVKFLNLISAYYLLIFLINTSFEYIYYVMDINMIFGYNYNLYVNLFFIISTLTVILFFLSISDVFYIVENMKIEYTLLVFYIYMGSLLLISSLDFISIIILLECIAFSSYILVGFERKNKFSTSSALKYLILASVPSGFFILGISLLYNNYGSFYLNYLDKLLVSCETFKNSLIHWSFILEYTNYNSEKIDSKPDLLYHFVEYISGFDEVLKNCNPGYLHYVNQILDFILYLNNKISNYEAFIYSSDNVLVEEVLHLTALRDTAAVLYIEYFARYLLVMHFLNEFLALWSLIYNLFTDTIYIGQDPYGPVNDLVMVIFKCNFSTQGLMNWFSFLSLNEYNTIWPALSELQRFSLNLHSIEAYQKVNLIKLSTEGVWDETFFFLNNNSGENDFWSKLENILHTNSFFYNNVTRFLIDLLLERLGDLSDILNYKKIDNNTFLTFIINFYSIFYLYHFFDTDNSLIWTDFSLVEGFAYDNIFLSTYIILIFILINLLFKITAAPFHLWAPSVYGGSPLPTITFLSVFSKLTVIFLFINIFLPVFDNLKYIWQPLLFFAGVFSVIISIIGAFSEKMFKRFFVYSSIGHIGFIILGISAFNYDGIKGAIDYLILYIISSFIVWFIVMHLTKKTTHLISFKGLSYNNPILSLILVIALFSISGLPPMGGFFVKYEIFYCLVNASQYFLGLFLFFLTVFSFFYYLRLIKIIYFEDNKSFKKNKNLNDIKLRLISILILILPLYIFLLNPSLNYILKTIITNLL